MNLRSALGQRGKGGVNAHGRTNRQVMGIGFDLQQLMNPCQVDDLLKPSVLLRDPQACVRAACHQLRLRQAGAQGQQLAQLGGQGVMRIQMVTLGTRLGLDRRSSGRRWVKVHGAGSIQNRAIAGATAQVARDGFHGLFSRDGTALGALVQVVQRHDKTRGAKTALRGVVVDHGLLHRVELTLGRQVAGGGDCHTVRRMRHANATVDRVALRAVAQVHGASAAIASGATFFDIGGMQCFTQQVQQGCGRWYIV